MANEKRLIDANALTKAHCEGCAEDIQAMCKTDPVCGTMMWVVEAPTVDAVEVVRCKDCKHFCPFYNECSEPHNHYTEEGFREVYDNDFCSYGERKDNG